MRINPAFLTKEPTMVNPPTRTRVRRTTGSKKLESYIDRNGVRPVAVYIPEPLHRALASTAIESETTLQSLITIACGAIYGAGDQLPPLVAPTRIKADPHKSVTWYADLDLHKKMKLLGVEYDCSVQQLILSAIVEHLKDAPRIKALKIKAGYPPFSRGAAAGALVLGN